MEQDIKFLLQWYFQLLILGLIFLPITLTLFGNFKDRGYIFSKIVATLFISYTVFIFGVTKTLPFTQLTIILVLIIFLIINFWVGRKIGIQKIARQKWKIFLFEELFFLVCLVFWSFIKAHEPSIQTLEKFMDFGFINSNLRANFLPATDMWFAPLPINYYYFGHFVAALFTKLSGIPSYITYNLMLATIFSYTAAFTFSIGITLLSKTGILKMREILGGILTAALVTLSGNLHTLYAFFTPYPQTAPEPITSLPFSPLLFPNNYWYPNATRFIPFTIHEFPLYSFVVSDLHGHVSDIPFVLFGIAVILELFLSKKILRGTLIILSLTLSVMYMTNAWDALIYGTLGVLIIFAKKIQTAGELGKTLRESVPLIAMLFLAVIIFSIPFSISFKPFVSGIGVMCAPDFLTKIGHIGPFLFEPNHCQRSAFWQLTILYGFFYFFVGALIISLIKRQKKEKMNPPDVFMLITIFLSTLLIILPEFFYAKDIYPQHYRANTMFKLTYEAFIMLSIVVGYTITKISTSRRNYFSLGTTVVLLYLVFSYPVFAINAFYSGLQTYHGLNGISYLKTLHPQDYDAIMFLNKNISGQPIVLEAQGDSYTDYGRISANTGLPTVLGWTVHEWLWRGSYDIPAPRITDVKTLYETTDINTIKQLLKKYNVSYIYVGDLEHQKYPNINEEKFNNLGKIIFQSGNTKIYRINY